MSRSRSISGGDWTGGDSLPPPRGSGHGRDLGGVDRSATATARPAFSAGVRIATTRR